MGMSEVLVHTGQHYDDNMSAVFFEELDIPTPNYNLGIGGGSHGQNTGRMLEAIEQVVIREKPDWVLVYGDTDSTLAGALAAAKLRVPVAHVEAGLRSFNRRMPEELNRVLTDHASDLHFAPTETAIENLAREGIAGGSVRWAGDVMYDAALFYGDRAERESGVLDRLNVQPKGYALATVHRSENTDDPTRLRAIMEGLGTSGVDVILPLHPRTRRKLHEAQVTLSRSIRAIDPVGYLDMVMLERNALRIATDSGGVQKEAYFQRVPCITLRDETEWVELVEIGANQLVGADADKISAALLNTRKHEHWPPLYGDGHAGNIIARTLREG
jgi:UDP-GlcNAc3NAcA epimerase